MSALFLIVRIFPIWALPVAFVIGEVGMYYRRKRSKLQFLWFGLSGVLVLMSIIWGITRGDIHSDEWVRDWTGETPNIR